MELTRYLETEQYGEAISLLEFLLQCQGEEEHYSEWRSLLDWLRNAFPNAGQTAPVLEEEWSEQELLQQHFQGKVEQDSEYVTRMLDTVLYGPLTPQKLLALEQLALIDHPDIDAVLLQWLETNDLHPLLQFHILQTLRKRGVTGGVQLFRGQEMVELDIEATPARYDDFPEAILKIPERVRQHTEIHEPGLSFLAQELWEQCVMTLYGTEAYKSILDEDEQNIDMWAGALHQVMKQLLSEQVEAEPDKNEILETYGITGALRFRYEQIYRQLRSLMIDPLRNIE